MRKDPFKVYRRLYPDSEKEQGKGFEIDSEASTVQFTARQGPISWSFDKQGHLMPIRGTRLDSVLGSHVSVTKHLLF